MATRDRHILGFAKMLLVQSFSAIPLGLLTTISLAACYFVKELTSLAIFHLGKLYGQLESKEDALSLRPFILFSFLDCCGITLLYWLRPAHDSIVMRAAEDAFMRGCLRMDFERFYSTGPAKNAARIYRSVAAIRESTSILIFDMLGNVIVVLSSLRILWGMLESSTFACFSAAICVLAVLQVLLFATLRSLKRQCIRINDSLAEEMSGFYENFVLVKVTDTNERRRMDPLFRSCVFLVYRVLADSVMFQSSLYFVAINVLVLYMSTRVRDFMFSYLKELALLVVALNSMIAKGFDLESKRIELEDMEQDDEACDEIDANARAATQDICAPAVPAKTIELLELSNVCVFLQGVPILQNMSLKIAKNDRIALIGRNGSGKSTFFKFLLGFLKYSGHANANCEAIDMSSGALRGHVSYLSQNKFLEGTILEVLREVIPDDDEAMAVCKRFGAHRFIDGLARGYQTPMEELSHAQQQMVNVIRACSRKSDILLADEPVDCLDPSNRDSVMDILLASDSHLIKVVILHSKEFIHKFNRVLVAGEHTIKSYTLNAYMETARNIK